MIPLAIIAGLLALVIVCATLLLHQHNASKREEKRIALLDKGLDMVGEYLSYNAKLPYPNERLPQKILYEEIDESELVGLIESRNESKSGSESESESGAFNGSESKKQQIFNAVFNYYIRWPDASLADGARSLNMAEPTLSRYHAALVKAGNLEPFPKNR